MTTTVTTSKHQPLSIHVLIVSGTLTLRDISHMSKEHQRASIIHIKYINTRKQDLLVQRMVKDDHPTAPITFHIVALKWI